MDKCAALQYLKFINSLKDKDENQRYYDFLFWLKHKKVKKRGKKKNE